MLESVEFTILAAICVPFILCHLFYWRESLEYSSNLKTCLLISFLSLLLTIFGIGLELKEEYKRFGYKLRKYSRLTYVTFDPFMPIIFTVLGLNYKSTAQNDYILIIDTIYVYLSNMITIGILMMLCIVYLDEK